MKLPMIVTVLPALTNAYVSVLSATGSLLIAGASRCDDIPRLLPCRPQQLGHERAVPEHDLSLLDEHPDLAPRRVAHVDHHRDALRRREVLVADRRLLARRL